MSKKELKILTCAAFVALAVPCAAAPASAPSATGLPRNIVPVRPPDIEPPTEAIESNPEDNAPPDAAPESEAPPFGSTTPTSVPPRRAPTIEIGDLGTVEGPAAGLIDDSNGGLGYAMWQGTTRATVVTMLKSVPATTASEAQRLLIRKILLTTAPPPSGSADASFNAMRLTKLIDAGLADDAADLAVRMNAPQNGEIVRAQTDALIYSGRDADMCGDLTTRRLDSADAAWVELRAYCYAVAKDGAALELTRAVIDAQGIVDPAFNVLLDGTLKGKAVAPESIRLPDALQLLMLQRLKLPIPTEMGPALGLPAYLAMAGSTATATPIRVFAAEKALRAGVLPTPLLAEILDTFRFAPAELVGAPAAARGESMMSGLSRLRAAYKASQRADERADIVHTAFEIGQREGVLGQVALLFADQAATFFPPANWTIWSDLMVRGLLLGGQSDAALRWFAILNPDIPDMKEVATQLALVLALAAPDVADDTVTQARLSTLALQASSPDGKNSPQVAARATLALGLFNALGRPMPSDAQALVPALVRQSSAGRRPAPALMQRIDNAVKSGARGDLALSVVAALGTEGVRDLAPDVIVRLVLALRSAGIQDAADALASEAMLLRPALGA